MAGTIGLFVWSGVGGLVGTGLMDIADSVAERLGITSHGSWGGNRALGRWALSILRGRFVHKDIVKSSSVRNELAAGWIFHYLTGASLALTYPVLYLAFRVSVPEDHVVPALLWGLATTLLPSYRRKLWMRERGDVPFWGS